MITKTLRLICLLTLLLIVTRIAAQSTKDPLFINALEQHDTKQIVDLGQPLYRTAVQHKNWREADFYANHIADAYSHIGTNYYKSGQYPLAISASILGVDWLTRSKAGSDTLQFQLSSLLSACYGRIPIVDSATYWYTRTSTFLTSHPVLRQTIPADVCGYYLSHANFLNLVGDIQRAFDYLQVAAHLAAQTKNRRLMAIAHNYAGNYFFRRRQHEQAGNSYQKALQTYDKGSVDQCWGYVTIGNNDRVAGRPSQGLLYLQTGHRLYQHYIKHNPQKRHINFEIQSAYYMAECERALNQRKVAIRHYEHCLTLHQQHYGPRGEFIAYCWLGLSRLEQQQANWGRALAFAKLAARASSYRLNSTDSPADYLGTTVNEKTLYESLRLQAELWHEVWQEQHSLLPLLKSVHYDEQALVIAARLRRTLVPTESKFFLSNEIAPIVERALAGRFALWQQTKQKVHKQRLFAMMERHRAMATSDILHEKYRLQTTLPPTLIRREYQLREQKSGLEKAVADESDQTRIESIQKKLDSVKVVTYHFLDSLETAYPRYFTLKYENRPLHIEQMQQRLPTDGGYLTYHLGKKSLVGCLVSRSGSAVFQVPIPVQFTQTVEQLWQSIQQPPGMFDYSGQHQAVTLYDWLIRPITDSLRPVRRLVVARDGLLHYIPFDLLQPHIHSARMLGDEVAISYAYSAELTFFDVSSKKPGPLRVSGFAPYSNGFRPNQADSAYVLKWSLSEIQAWGGKIWAGADATKKRFQQVTDQNDVVILATHAFADQQQPERSYVAFHPTSSDSLLRAPEIANLPLDNIKLLVLNACEGNSGILQSGEGPLSLARVFRLAGCRAILTTAWKASDASTAAFNRLFQQYLADGLPTDLALQQTRVQFRTDKRYAKWRHPFHWVNATLLGAPIILYPTPRSTGWYYWAVAGLSILLLTGWSVWQRWQLTKPGQPT